MFMLEDPYRTVLISVISAFSLLIFLLVYRFIYPKKVIGPFKLLILISILPLLSLLRPGVYESGDFSIHIYRSMEFYRSLSEGLLMPSWAGNLNANYGYPLFTFNYVLPYYLISFFHFLGFSFVSSMKLFFAVCFISSGISMYFLGKTIFKNDSAALTSSVFYLFAPYHLISLHFKNTIGEIFVFITIPLVFAFIEKFLSNKKFIYLLLAGFFLGITALGHIFIAMVLIPIIFFYILFSSKNINKSLIHSFILFLIASLISIYQWGAVIVYSSSLFTSQYPVDIKNLYYPTLKDLLYSPWRMGFLYQGSYGEISNLLGYIQLFSLVYIAYLTLRKKNLKHNKNKIFFWILLILTSIFMVNRASISIWNLFPYINAAGPHRLLILTTFSISIIAGYLALLNKSNKKLIYILIFLAISLTILNWGNRKVIAENNDETLRNNIPYSTAQSERHFYANSKWVNPNSQWFKSPPQNHLEIVNGQGKVLNIKRSSTKHNYIIDAKTQLEIKENTLFFPGWKLTSNKVNIDIYPDDDGIIKTTLPSGLQVIEFNYQDLGNYKLFKIISLLTSSLIIFWIFYLSKSKAIDFYKTLKKYLLFHR